MQARMEGYILEIKFKPEPEKKDTGAGTPPEEKPSAAEETIGAAETGGAAEPEAEKPAEPEENVTEETADISPVETGTGSTAEGAGTEDDPEESAGMKRRRRSRKRVALCNDEEEPGGADGESRKEMEAPEDSRDDDILKTVGEAVEKKPLRLWQKIMLAAGVVVLAVILTFGFSIWREYSRTESTEGNPVEVTIDQGSSTRQVAQELKDAGVIRYETAFLLKIYFSDDRGKLRYGTFELNDGMCLDDVIEALVTGGAQKKEDSFTIPEGYSIPMIAEKLENEGVMSQEEFLTAVENAAADFQYKDILPAADQVFYQLEGYIFPDTYYLSKDMTGDELVAKILDEFLQKFDEQRQQEAEAMGMSVEEVLIRASLVQKETERPEEYPMVAGVINNRLAQNMRLQFDSTVVYAMTKGMYGVDRVLYADLEIDSPYNTYKNDGLPVGPICSPSLEAIDGVLHPAEHNYLYFQTDQVKNDGSNLYFETYEEHAAAAATTENPSASSDQDGENTEAAGSSDGAAATSDAAGQTTAASDETGETTAADPAGETAAVPDGQGR